jgi:hypothetical protein
MRLIFVFIPFLFVFCSRESSSDPTGVATWSTDCTGIVVAINRAEERSSLFGTEKINQRYDLILCDSNAIPVDTLLSNRNLDGNAGEVVNLFYDPTDNYVVVESNDLSAGQTRMEYVYLNGTVKRVYGLFAMQYNKLSCPHGRLEWDEEQKFYIVD